MFKPKFTKADIRKHIEQRVERYQQALINRLSYVGETFVRNARLNHTYMDQTGNLTASIGFMVLHNGEAENESAVGPQKASNFADELKAKFTNGYVLVVYAGMEYAAAVESRGKDVLTASSIEAKTQLEEMLDQFQSKMNASS